MPKMIDSPRGAWRYSPGLWVRGQDGSVVERQDGGPRDGIWKARVWGGAKHIPTEKSECGYSTWLGFHTAAAARAAVDKYIDEHNAAVDQALRQAEQEA